MSYAVVLPLPEVPDEHAGALAEALVRATGMTQLDALQRVKRVEGILLDGADENVAKALAKSVRGSGIEVGVAPMEAFSRYRRRIPVRRAECAEAGLRVEIGRDEWRLARWSTIRAGSLALYREPRLNLRIDARHRRHVGRLAFGMTGALGLAFAPKVYRWARDAAQARDEIQRLAQADTYVLDLFADPGATLRFDARKFHYGYLGDRMHERCELNFHSLVADIADRAADAAFAPAVQRFLKGEPLETALTDPHDFDLFNRWFLLAVAAFRSK